MNNARPQLNKFSLFSPQSIRGQQQLGRQKFTHLVEHRPETVARLDAGNKHSAALDATAGRSLAGMIHLSRDEEKEKEEQQQQQERSTERK